MKREEYRFGILGSMSAGYGLPHPVHSFRMMGKNVLFYFYFLYLISIYLFCNCHNISRLKVEFLSELVNLFRLEKIITSKLLNTIVYIKKGNYKSYSQLFAKICLKL